MYNTIISTINHPDSANPRMGVYNSRSVDALDRTGIDTNVIVPRPFAPPIGPHSKFSKVPTVEQWMGYQIHHPRFLYAIPKRLFYGLTGNSYAKRVSKYIDSEFEPPSVYHGGHIYPDGFGLIKHAKRSAVVTATAHGTSINKFERQPSNVQQKIKATLRELDAVTCVSQDLISRVKKIEPGANAKLISLGADPNKYPTNSEMSIRSELGIGEATDIVLFVGHLNKNKGIPEIMSLLDQFKPDKETLFIFVGHGGNLRWDLQDKISNLSDNIEARLYWNLSPLALRRIYVVADILLLPSHSEGRPTVIYEGMASKTPVISTNVGGIPEQVADRETGWLIEPGDVDSLNRLLSEVLSMNRESLAEFGIAGYRRLIEKQWTWDDYAQKMTSLHMDLIES